MCHLQEPGPFVQHLFSTLKKLFHCAVMADEQQTRSKANHSLPYIIFIFVSAFVCNCRLRTVFHFLLLASPALGGLL